MTEPNFDTRCQTRISRNAMWRRRATALLCAFSLSLQQACYNSVPVEGAATPPSGPVTITVNEHGRLLVGNRLGSLIDHVDGRIVRADGTNVLVAVETAEDVRGNMARWGGEQFTIPREGIQTMTAKKVSKGRTGFLLGGILTVLVVGVLALRGGKSGQNGMITPCGCEPI